MSKDIEVGDVWKHKKTKHWFMVTFYPEDPNDKWYSIIWDNDNARYNVSGYGEIAYLNYNEIEVIGNIHKMEIY